MTGYKRHFHMKRKGHPRYGWIAGALVSAAAVDGVKRTTFLDIGSSIGCLLNCISGMTGLPKENLYGADYGQVVADEYDHEHSTYSERDLSSGPAVVIPGWFDVIVCQEVAEHIPSEYEDNVVSSVSINISPDGILLWSAAVPGQRGKGHVNLRLPGHWMNKIASAGLVPNERMTMAYRKHLDTVVPDDRRKEMGIYRDSIIFSSAALYNRGT